MSDTFDVLVVGGGINGAGIARDAAGRGLSVCLCEQDDLAAHTSSASTKLVHGGLRYLRNGEFALVRKALNERETVRRLAPHLVRPTTFVLPHASLLRPAWVLRAGLWLYDHLGRRRDACGWPPIRPAQRCSRSTVPVSATPMRAWTMRDWWSSMRWMRTNAAPGSGYARVASS